MSDTPITKTCSCCKVERPIWAYRQYYDNRTSKRHTHSRCRGCNRRIKPGLTHEEIVSSSNASIDRIARREKRPAFSMDAWVKREADQIKAENAAMPPIEALPEDVRRMEIERLTAELEAAELAQIGPIPSGGAIRAAKRRARKAATDQVDKAEREAQRNAALERRRERYASMDGKELLQDAFKRTVKALRRARGRAVGNRRAHAAGVYERRVTIRPPKKGLPWQFTEAEIRALLTRSQLRCEVSGIEFDMRDLNIFRPRYPFSPSLDQIDPARGYVFTNARLVCLLYNYSKNDTNDVLAKEYIIKLADGIRGKHAHERATRGIQ